MQVSIYIEDSLLKKIDQKAKKTSRSRSEFIQIVLEKEILNKKEKSIFGEVFGILNEKERKKLSKSIHLNRKNSSRFE